MSMKMESNININSCGEQTGQFGKTAYSNIVGRTKPNPGLKLENLMNLPKEIKKKNPSTNVKLSSSSSNFFPNKTMKSPSNMGKSKDSFNFSKTNIQLPYKNQTTDRGLRTSNSQNFRSSRQKYSHVPVQSPTSNIFKSYKCHKYHTDLDFNLLTNEKFYKDAVSCGKKRLSTVSIRNSSPDKYYYENKKTPKNQNRYSKNLTWGSNIVSSLDEKGNENNVNPNPVENTNTYENSMKMSHMSNEYQQKKTSQGILSDILDLQFSVNSPSQLKIFQNEEENQKTEEFKKNIQTQNNFLNLENKDKIYTDDNHKLTINLSYMGENPREKFLEALENVMTYLDPIFENLSIEERVEKFLISAEDSKRAVRLGSVVALYIMIRKFQMEDNLRLLILEKTISLMQNYESQEELFLVACLEICALFAPHELLLENLGLICMFITDFNFPTLQKSAFNCLMCMEYEGIKTLVELASKDYQEYQKYILSSLIRTPHIQKIIIIRALLNEVYSNNADRKHSALAALNRMHDLVGDTDALDKLAKFFHEPKIEKIFLSSTIRTAGLEGERILINEIRNNKDFSIRVAIASVLAYRLPKRPNYLKIKLDNNDTYSLTKKLPGSFCTYYGKVSPYVYESDEEDLKEYLEVSTRDFLAALQRMLIMNYDHSSPQIVHNGHFNLIEGIDFSKSSSEVILKYANYFDLGNNNSASNSNNTLSQSQNQSQNNQENVGNNQENTNENTNTNSSQSNDDQGKLLVSEEVIKALCICLKDYSTAVRDTAASSLGQLGLPEALLALNHLVDAINDEDVNVRSKVIWAIGRIAAGCDNSVIIPIVEALKSNMWKVKSTCLFALSQFGYRAAKLAVPILIKLLKESAINKQAIAETLVKLGSEGESTLLRVMNQENDSNYKLKSSISRALSLANINSPNIDFVVECLFKSCKSNSSLIRKNALFAIRMLAEKADEKVTYLKRKNVIPFFYEMMMDKDFDIQMVTIYIYIYIILILFTCSSL